jgi:CRP-like cAMP-binding protein
VDEEEAATALRRNPLFSEVRPEALRHVARALRRRQYRRDEVIFHQGDQGDALHVIASGAVKIVLEAEDGAEAILVTLRPPESFGEIAMLDGAPRSASAIALEPTTTLVLPGAELRQLMDADTTLRDAMFASLAAGFRRLTTQVEELHFLDVPGRLATRLSRLAAEVDPDANEVVIPWPYNQSDLAAMIGATRQSVNRVFNELVDAGLVRRGQGTLVITDVAALRRAGDR